MVKSTKIGQNSGVKLSIRLFCFVSVLQLGPKHYSGCHFVYMGPVNY